MSTFEERWCGGFIDKSVVIACRAGVLLVLANLTSLPLFIHPAKFDLKLEWVVGAGGRGRGRGRGRAKRCLPKDTRHYLQTPPPPPWYKFISHPCLPLPLKAKMVALIFCQENTELLLTKITPAPQDSVVKEYMRQH